MSKDVARLARDGARLTQKQPTPSSPDDEEPGPTFTPQGVHPAPDEPSEGGEDADGEEEGDAGAPKIMDLGQLVNSIAEIGNDPKLKTIQTKLHFYVTEGFPLWDKMLRELIENSRATRAAVDPAYAAALAARKKGVGK